MKFLILFFLGFICINYPAFSKSQDLYLSGDSKTGIILCHGGGAHPDWKVVGYLRRSLNSGNLKAHTISLQMPIAKGVWTNYIKTFPDAILKIQEGIAKLKKANINKIILIGHSMGSRMGSYFLANKKSHGVSLFVGLGMRNNGDEELNVVTNIRKINIPILDVYGSGGNKKDFKYGKERKAKKIKALEQKVIEGANHKFEGHENQLDAEITAWIESKL